MTRRFRPGPPALRRLLLRLAVLFVLLVPAFGGSVAGGPQAHAATAPDPAATSAASTPTPSPTPTASSSTCAFGAVACQVGRQLGTAATTSTTATNPGTTTEIAPTGVGSLPAVAKETAEAAEKILHDTFGWWLKTSSVPLNASGGLKLQAVMLGFAAIVLTMLVIVQGIRMSMTRRGTPFAELIRGSLIAAVVVGAGVALVDSAMLAGDKLATAIIAISFADSDALVKRMTDVLLGAGITNQSPTLLLMFSLIVLLAGIVQAVILFLRQTAVPMLGILLPIAGVGQAGPPATQSWLPKLVNVLFAIILYKPVVAVVLSLGFVNVKDGATLLDAIRGGVTLAISVIAFPAMLKLFAPTSKALALRSGGGLTALGGIGGGAVSYARSGSGTPGDTTAVQHAAFMQAAASGGGRSARPGQVDQRDDPPVPYATAASDLGPWRPAPHGPTPPGVITAQATSGAGTIAAPPSGTQPQQVVHVPSDKVSEGWANGRH